MKTQKRVRIGVFSLILAMILLCSRAAFAATWHVDDNNVSGTHNGSSWTTAFQYVQDALDSASTGDTIKVAKGTYYPDDDMGLPAPDHVDNDRNEAFFLKPNVQLLGGYIGLDNPSSPDTRDIISNETILSGNTGNTGVETDNSYSVVNGNGVGVLTLLEGFTIRDGYGGTSSGGWQNGAGIFNPEGTRPTIQNCLITNNKIPGTNGRGGGMCNAGGFTSDVTSCSFSANEASYGAGLFNINGSRSLYTACQFKSNLADSAGAGAYTDVTEDAGERVRFSDCLFENNIVSRSDSTPVGGGFCNAGGDPILRGCLFIGNQAIREGDGSAEGGGAWSNAGDPKFVECLFDSNRVVVQPDWDGWGAGLWIHAGGDIYNSTFRFNIIEDTTTPTPLLRGFGGGLHIQKHVNVTNTLVYKNQAATGGGIYAPNAGLNAVNCTVTNNVASIAGGGIYYAGSAGSEPHARIRNCIVWNNLVGESDIESAQVDGAPLDGNLEPIVTYCAIQNCDVFCSTSATNIPDDVQFADAPRDDFRLKPCSKVIDRGNTLVVPEDLLNVDADGELACNDMNPCNVGERTPDLLRSPRVVDSAFRSDIGIAENLCVPCTKVVDMGVYEDQPFVQPPCNSVRGDVNVDGLVDGRDIDPFVACLIAGDPPEGNCPCADLTFDDSLDMADVTCFVPMLLTGLNPCACSVQGGARWWDCNENEVPDATDIGMGTSADCNANFIPDECDIASDHSPDVNTNGIPDKCEPDCNVNGIPDDKDIADETSADLNANGIPDECEPDCNANSIPDDMDVDPMDPDGNSQVSADCNANGQPDECEPDCNSNGVPDDCDIEPLDPDGDEWVSPDCNGNGMPDECDMAMGPPFGSFDCNENGIPDECDIASETSADCNENGIPDECDIAAEISEDTNENGIPDECEQEGRMGGGDSPSPPPSPLEGEGAEAAWVEYYDWVAEQQWGPNAETPMFEQFKRSVDKLRELGLLPA